MSASITQGHFFGERLLRTADWTKAPNVEHVPIEHKIQGGTAQLVSLIGGALSARVLDETGSILKEAICPPIRYMPEQGATPIFTYAVDWNEMGICMWINDQPFWGVVPTQPFFEIRTCARPVSELSSIQRPEAYAACEKWIINRKSKFSRSLSSPDRRPKTVIEQVEDLRRSMLVMGEAIVNLSEGKTYVIGTLASELRACVTWTNDDEPDRNLNPLLLRLASKADSPLPVYSTRRNLNEPASAGSEKFSTGAMLSAYIESRLETDVLMDLQEWLEADFLRIGASPGVTINTKRAIAEAAYTLGSSHYDEAASEFLEASATFSQNHNDEVTNRLVATGLLVIELGEWVIDELNAKGLIV